MSKLLTSAITESITYLSDKYDLLPSMHFGGCPGCTTTDAMHYMVQNIKHAWCNKKVVSALFLDIEGAFPHANTDCLIHDTCMRRFPTELAHFIESSMSDHSTVLKFDDYTSLPISIDSGIGQGDLPSMPYYTVFNSGLIEVARGPNKKAIAFVDNTVYLAIGPNFEDTHAILQDMLLCPKGALDWAKTHNSSFKFLKLALVDFTRSSSKAATSSPLQLPTVLVPLSPSTRYLGIFFDQCLSWKMQHLNATRKGTSYVSTLC